MATLPDLALCFVLCVWLLCALDIKITHLFRCIPPRPVVGIFKHPSAPSFEIGSLTLGVAAREGAPSKEKNAFIMV